MTWPLWILDGVLSALPVIIALKRKHASIALLSALSLIASWTIIGWILIMIWAIWGKSDAREFAKQDREY